MSLYFLDYLSVDFGQGQMALDMTRVEEDLEAWPRSEWALCSSDLPLKHPVYGLNLIQPKPCSQPRLTCTQNTAVNRQTREARKKMKADHQKALSFRVVC